MTKQANTTTKGGLGTELRGVTINENKAKEKVQCGAMACKGAMILLGSGIHTITHIDNGQTATAQEPHNIAANDDQTDGSS